MGAFDMAKYYDDIGGSGQWCAPEGIVATRLRELMVAFWRENQELRRHTASSALHFVLRTTFPGACRR